MRKALRIPLFAMRTALTALAVTLSVFRPAGPAFRSALSLINVSWYAVTAALIANHGLLDAFRTPLFVISVALNAI